VFLVVPRVESKGIYKSDWSSPGNWGRNHGLLWGSVRRTFSSSETR